MGSFEQAVVSNVTDAVVNGHYALSLEPYLGESSTWPGVYTSDPATNRCATLHVPSQLLINPIE